MGCKFDYIEEVFGESNPALAEKLNAKHLEIVHTLIATGNYEVVNDTLVKKAAGTETTDITAVIEKMIEQEEVIKECSGGKWSRL